MKLLKFKKIKKSTPATRRLTEKELANFKKEMDIICSGTKNRETSRYGV